MHVVKKYLAPYFPLFKVAAVALIAFTFYRLCFLFFNSDAIPDHPHDPVFLYWRSLIYGLNYDLAIICYFVAPFLVFIFVKDQLNSTSTSGFRFFKIFFNILFIICFLICAADIPYYRQFGNHINKGASAWAGSPGFVLQLIFSNIAYWGYLLLFMVLSAFFMIASKKIFSTIELKKREIPRGVSIAVFIALAGFTFIGIRGRTALKSPLRVGTAFFSEYAFFNQLGLNPCFVLVESLSEHNKEWPFLRGGYTDAELKNAISAISVTPKEVTNGFERNYTSDAAPRKYNVMIVLMESMSMSKLGYYKCERLASRFDSLVGKGVFFDHFYSAGIHTFNGIFSTETGFPAIMDTHPLNTYMNKAFKGISYWLKKNGYGTYFFTSHDPQFDNMEGFLKFNNIENLYSQYSFPQSKAHGPLGLSDHFLLESALEKMNEHHKTQHTPFFSYVLTSSDHGPWEIPDDIPFKPTASTQQDKATQYADWALGDFIEKAKKYEWFDSTLFIFVADHGVSLGHTYSMPLSYNHIPCLFYMPAQLKTDTISSVGGQIDVLPTLLSFLKIPFKNPSMGIDLMHEKRPYMYFSADSKIGCIDEKYYYIHLLDEQKELLYQFKNLDTYSFYEELKPKADSMSRYASRMIKAADHIIKRKLY